MALINKLKSIADAIREKTGKTDGLTLDAMPEEIKSIKTAKEPYVEETYDDNGNLVGFRFSEGYTEVRKYYFYYCDKLESVDLPDHFTKIKNYGFAYCTNLTNINIPKNLNEISYGAFQHDPNLLLSELPVSLRHIYGNTFFNCAKITIKTIPQKIANIYSNAFYGCVGLTEMTFEGKPTYIAPDAFSGCTNLSVINVPWSEGAVANAPWGAENATINYDFESGGVNRNLIRNSALLKDAACWEFTQFTTFDSEKTRNGHPSIKISVDGKINNKWYGARNYYLPTHKITIQSGKTYSLSCWYYVEDSSLIDVFFALELKGYKGENYSNSTSIGAVSVYPTNCVEGQWTRTQVTFTLDQDYDQCFVNVYVTRNGTVWFTDFKLEEGSEVTNWSPAPEDSEG